MSKINDQRFNTAQWVMERNLAWIAAAEVKVGIIVAIDAALLGSIGSVCGSAVANARTTLALIWFALTLLLSSIGIICASMAVLPRMEGPPKSLVFFGKISIIKHSEYIQKFKSSTSEDIIDDLLSQTHRNAQIANNKFYWVKKGMLFSFCSIIPWVISIILLSRK